MPFFILPRRERANKAYDTVTYFFAKLLAELPLNLVPPIFFGLIIYNIPGLDPDRYGHVAKLFCVFICVVFALCHSLIVVEALKTIQTPAMFEHLHVLRGFPFISIILLDWACLSSS